MGTQWEHIGNRPNPPLAPSFKTKKLSLPKPFIGLPMKYLVPKELITIFNVDLPQL